MNKVILSITALLFLSNESLADKTTSQKPGQCTEKFEFSRAPANGNEIDIEKLTELTSWVEKNTAPIFSVLISKNGKVLYELYTSDIEPDAAHYLMSITKSVTSTLAGIAIDQGRIKSTDEVLSSLLPKSVFKNEEQIQKFSALSLKDIMGMSALDIHLYPTKNTDEAKANTARFFSSANRLAFALGQKLLARLGTDFLYTDVTPILTTGVVQYAVHQSLFDFAKISLFDPMDFKNAEWMHQDEAGFDNGAYGLRLRPIDMQKLGILFLNQGCWNQKRLVSENWVNTAFTPWLRSKPTNHDPDYGWNWWKDWFNNGWIGHIANGWLGQRVAVFPEQNVVVTMTGEIRNGTEDKVFATLMNDFVIPALTTQSKSPQAQSLVELKSALEHVRSSKSKISGLTEWRLVPSIKSKGEHQAFRDDSIANINPGP